MRKLKEGGNIKKELYLAWAVSARNSLEIIGGYTPNQKVFGHNRNTLNDKSKEDMTVSELEEQVDNEKLR